MESWLTEVSDGLPGVEGGVGTGLMVTVKVCVRVAAGEALSVTLYVTVDPPVVSGVPDTLLSDSVNANPDGRPLTLYAYGDVPPLASGNVNDASSPSVRVRSDGSGSVRGTGAALVVPYRMRDQAEAPAALPARTSN